MITRRRLSSKSHQNRSWFSWCHRANSVCLYSCGVSRVTVLLDLARSSDRTFCNYPITFVDRKKCLVISMKRWPRVIVDVIVASSSLLSELYYHIQRLMTVLYLFALRMMVVISTNIIINRSKRTKLWNWGSCGIDRSQILIKEACSCCIKPSV